MGEILQQMLGIFLIALLLVFCDSFPQANDRNLPSTEKENKFMIEKVISEIKGTVLEISGKDDGSLTDDVDRQITGAKSIVGTTITEKVFRTIRRFTENTVSSMLKFYLIKRRKLHNTNMESSDVILGDGSSVTIMQNSTTMDLALTKPSASAAKYDSIVKKDSNNQNIDKIKMPAPAKSKVDHWLPGLLNYRRRRSFLSDFGIQFESAFEDDTTDVVFGAHTSPCDYANRHYCLNGGTCVFLGALDMKTCRCKIGYTGLRCEMINQEFLLALLSEEFFG